MDSKIADLEKMSKLTTSRIHDDKGNDGNVFARKTSQEIKQTIRQQDTYAPRKMQIIEITRRTDI